MSKQSKRSTFGSRFGAIAVVGGGAVGLGNIWKFPYVAGENGGGAFILIYIVICFLIAIPVMLSEFAMGRSARSNPLGAVKKLSVNKGWRLIGYISILAPIVILPFYSVIAGWSLEFIRASVMNEFAGATAVEVTHHFNNFVASGWKPIVWTLLFLTVCGLIVGLGINRGIERYSKILMPTLVLLLVLLGLYSTTLSGFGDSTAFLFKPDFSKVTGKTFLQALGQAFFSMSIGMGAMITYGSYIGENENLGRVAGTVAIVDVVVAMLAGLAIFPAVFSYGISPTSGPDLVFITLPALFGQMAGGYVVGILFFILLLFAAMTSAFSLLEVMVAYCTEEFKVSRKLATGVVFCVMAVLAVLCALSQMPDSRFAIGGMSLFDVLDYTSSNFILPIGGLLVTIFAGWVMDRDKLQGQIAMEGTYTAKMYPLIRFLIRFVIPIAITIMFLNLIGFLK